MRKAAADLVVVGDVGGVDVLDLQDEVEITVEVVDELCVCAGVVREGVRCHVTTHEHYHCTRQRQVLSTSHQHNRKLEAKRRRVKVKARR